MEDLKGLKDSESRVHREDKSSAGSKGRLDDFFAKATTFRRLEGKGGYGLDLLLAGKGCLVNAGLEEPEWEKDRSGRKGKGTEGRCEAVEKKVGRRK
ncbi:hypothetical protein HZH68_008398 [Vespula germanica]|uniref:Uncharacterized protein n=1 Tax=Vespula germanica TaxID=30212 RepID=A0A834K605_VESGE|nr:hypothetical protein HZH68_008398 [Vespula germanica]